MCQVQAILPEDEPGRVSQNFQTGSETGRMTCTRHVWITQWVYVDFAQGCVDFEQWLGTADGPRRCVHYAL